MSNIDESWIKSLNLPKASQYTDQIMRDEDERLLNKAFCDYMAIEDTNIIKGMLGTPLARSISSCFVAAYNFVVGLYDSIYDWLYCRFLYNRYSIKYTKPGWMDIDGCMFYACFELLGKYVEGELGRISLNDDYHEDSPNSKVGYLGYRLHSVTYPGVKSSEQKAIDLWVWYKYGGLERMEQDFIANYHSKNRNAFIEKYGSYDINEIIDQKFNELMSIRTSLWT